MKFSFFSESVWSLKPCRSGLQGVSPLSIPADLTWQDGS
jgi:hypothetical protein